MAIDRNTAQFSQAQFALAPVILDLNNLNHRFLIFDCDDERRAFAAMQQIHAKPLKRNMGIILAEREDL